MTAPPPATPELMPVRGTNLPVLFGRIVQHIHGIGIGGMGLGPLAVYLAQLGFTVTGEDDA
ncbi:MAG: Mur ligase domain-containing protein, partial [Opitutus sp.]